MTLALTILGCGSSAGVPRPALGWGACDPNNPRNRRRRCSLMAERTSPHGTTRIVIDTSPDLREQLIDAGVSRLDAVIITHAHADHLHGIDDLRSINRLMRRAIPLFADAKTLAEIGRRFGYVLEPVPEPGRYHKPTLEPHEIRGPFEISGIPVIPVAQDHGFSTTLGLRIGAALGRLAEDALDENDGIGIPRADIAEEPAPFGCH